MVWCCETVCPTTVIRDAAGCTCRPIASSCREIAPHATRFSFQQSYHQPRTAHQRRASCFIAPLLTGSTCACLRWRLSPASPPGGMKQGHRVHFARGRSSCAPRPIDPATCAARRNPRPAPASLGLLRTLAHSQRLWHSGAYSSSSCVTWPLLVSLQTFGEAFARSARACCRRSHTSQHRQP